jgi:hypothetical protein
MNDDMMRRTEEDAAAGNGATMVCTRATCSTVRAASEAIGGAVLGASLQRHSVEAIACVSHSSNAFIDTPRIVELLRRRMKQRALGTAAFHRRCAGAMRGRRRRDQPHTHARPSIRSNPAPHAHLASTRIDEEWRRFEGLALCRPRKTPIHPTHGSKPGSASNDNMSIDMFSTNTLVEFPFCSRVIRVQYRCSKIRQSSSCLKLELVSSRPPRCRHERVREIVVGGILPSTLRTLCARHCPPPTDLDRHARILGGGCAHGARQCTLMRVDVSASRVLWSCLMLLLMSGVNVVVRLPIPPSPIVQPTLATPCDPDHSRRPREVPSFQ